MAPWQFWFTVILIFLVIVSWLTVSYTPQVGDDVLRHFSQSGFSPPYSLHESVSISPPPGMYEEEVPLSPSSSGMYEEEVPPPPSMNIPVDEGGERGTSSSNIPDEEIEEQPGLPEEEIRAPIENKQRRFRSVGEELSVVCLEKILGRTIQTNIRPPFLRNPETGRRLEYDGFDPIDRIAIEYNGEQHYNYPNSFHRSMREFQNQLYRDQVKVNLSRENRVKLIVIPYTVDTCVPDETAPNGYRKLRRVTRDQRYGKIRAFLEKALQSPEE